MAKFLITGGAGFIGSHLVESCLKKNHNIRVIDNCSTGFEHNLTPLLNDIEFIKADIRDYTTVDKAIKGCDFVLHHAAIPSVQRSLDDPLTTNEVNVQGTLNILWASLKNNIKRVVFAASSSYYGDTEVLPKIETMPPNPLSPYALQKLTGEYYLKLFHSLYGLETVGLRYFNIFGPKQDPNSPYSAVIPLFITSLVSNRRPVIYGDGTQSRDFTYVANVVEANMKACVAPKIACGRTYNIACGEAFDLNFILREINKLCGKKIDPIFENRRRGDVLHSLADITMAREFLQFEPIKNFNEGLMETVNYFKNKL